MPLTSVQRKAAGALLARAFGDNPGMAAVLDRHGPEQRVAALRPVMQTFVAAAERHGQVSLIEEGAGLSAVALMFAPGVYPLPLSFELRLAPGLLGVGLRGLLRFARMDAYMRKHHHAEPHWYLWFLGVEPALQGRGYGSQSLRALSERADHDGAPCYLETDRHSSVLLYQRHGYVVQREQRDPSGMPFTMWHMLRPAR